MDRRVKYTKMIIRETFINLLEKKNINKITVSEICKEADINRATFYRYYLDVYDLYDKVRDEFVVKLMGSIKTNDNIYTVSSYTRGFLETLISDKKLTKILFNTSDGMGTFLNDILEITYDNCYKKWKNDYPDLDDEDISYASIFIFNGALGIINYWVKNDFEQDIDYISNIIERLSYSGIKKFIYKDN